MFRLFKAFVRIGNVTTYLSDYCDISNPDEGFEQPKHVDSANTLPQNQYIYTVDSRSTVLESGCLGSFHV